MGLLARFSHIFGSQREVWITFNVTEKFAKFYAFWVFYETASSQQPAARPYEYRRRLNYTEIDVRHADIC